MSLISKAFAPDSIFGRDNAWNLQRSRNARFCDLCLKGLDTNRRVHNGRSGLADSELAAFIVTQNHLFVGGHNRKSHALRISKLRATQSKGFGANIVPRFSPENLYPSR